MNEPKRIYFLDAQKKLFQYSIPLLLPGVGYFFAIVYLKGIANYYQIDPNLLSVQIGDLIVSVVVVILVALILVVAYMLLATQLFKGEHLRLKKLISLLEIASGTILILVAAPLVIFSAKYSERTGNYSVISFQGHEYRLIQNQGDSMLVIPFDKDNKLQPDKVSYLQKSHDITIRYHRH